MAGRAYEQQSLMVTTNLHFDQWTEIFGSERLTGALLDRLTHRCHIIEANGESYRLRQSKKRTKSFNEQQTINQREKEIDSRNTGAISFEQVSRI